MIGSIIAVDHAEARDPRMLRTERQLAAGFGRAFPFPDDGCSGQPASASALPRQRSEGGDEPPVAPHSREAQA